MLQGWCTLLGAAWLFAASLEAPFAHYHPEDPDHHHASGFGHFHLGVPDHQDVPGELEIEERDENETAVWQDWASAASPRVSVAYAEAPSAPVWTPALVTADRAADFQPRSHGPPSVRLLPARSPPL
jgi:hypothetical protein